GRTEGAGVAAGAGGSSAGIASSGTGESAFVAEGRAGLLLCGSPTGSGKDSSWPQALLAASRAAANKPPTSQPLRLPRIAILTHLASLRRPPQTQVGAQTKNGKPPANRSAVSPQHLL